jgi:hypothetical protein
MTKRISPAVEGEAEKEQNKSSANRPSLFSPSPATEILSDSCASTLVAASPQDPSPNANAAAETMGAIISTGLVKYDAAKKALAAAHKVDEVKDIRDKAMAMQLYAMQAKDRVLIDHATEIRLRAERRAGEMLKAMEKNKGAVPGKTGCKGKPVLDSAPKLSELGINKSQSHQWQKLASLPEDEFEVMVANAKSKACTAIDRAQHPTPRKKPKPKEPETVVTDATAVMPVAPVTALATVTLVAPEPAPEQTPDEIIKQCVYFVGLSVRSTWPSLDSDNQEKLFSSLHWLITELEDRVLGDPCDQIDGLADERE